MGGFLSCFLFFPLLEKVSQTPRGSFLLSNPLTSAAPAAHQGTETRWVHVQDRDAHARDPGSRHTQGLRKTNWEDCHLCNPREATALLPSRPKGRDEMINFLSPPPPPPSRLSVGGLLGELAEPLQSPPAVRRRPGVPLSLQDAQRPAPQQRRQRHCAIARTPCPQASNLHTGFLQAARTLRDPLSSTQGVKMGPGW